MEVQLSTENCITLDVQHNVIASCFFLTSRNKNRANVTSLVSSNFHIYQPSQKIIYPNLCINILRGSHHVKCKKKLWTTLVDSSEVKYVLQDEMVFPTPCSFLWSQLLLGLPKAGRFNPHKQQTPLHYSAKEKDGGALLNFTNQ